MASLQVEGQSFGDVYSVAANFDVNALQVKHGGPLVAWQQPVLLTGASTSRLVVRPDSGRLPDVQIDSKRHP